ncbi:hypothetical protein QC762_407253 [Podospora pseudocomata]|uniref:Uncharacterized protein n=1 Tax=Podospora pseudocomata TaxID=2093779 RepID=A0ABR0GGA9_9PEZI|nr:hypothetical protein QC762_407253 [Podospora pseudocomata]
MSDPNGITLEFRDLPPPCWEVCNKAYQQVRLFETFPEYCKPESSYQINYSNCLVCCSTTQTNDIHKTANSINATLVSIFGEYTNRCNDFNGVSGANASRPEPQSSSGFTLAHIIGTVLGVVGGILLLACIVTAYQNRSRDKVERTRLLEQKAEGKRRELRKKDLESQSTTAEVDRPSEIKAEVSPMIREIEGNPRTEMEVEERACELDLGSGYSEMDVQPPNEYSKLNAGNR